MWALILMVWSLWGRLTIFRPSQARPLQFKDKVDMSEVMIQMWNTASSLAATCTDHLTYIIGNSRARSAGGLRFHRPAAGSATRPVDCLRLEKSDCR